MAANKTYQVENGRVVPCETPVGATTPISEWITLTVTVREVEQYIPPVTRELVKPEWQNDVDRFIFRLRAGEPINMAKRNSEKWRRIIGCALHWTRPELVKVRLRSGDEILRWEGVGVKGAPQLHLKHVLTDEGRHDLEDLLERQDYLTETERGKLVYLLKVDALIRWYAQYENMPLGMTFIQLDGTITGAN